MKKWSSYEYFVVSCMLLIPFVAIMIETLLVRSNNSLAEIAFKWVVFCGVGLRLGVAGIKQTIHPQFTAKDIFNILDDGVLPLVKELGFANISLSAVALISLFIPSFRTPACLAGMLYFGLAGFLHISKPKESSKEVFAMITDLWISIVLLALMIANMI